MITYAKNDENHRERFCRVLMLIACYIVDYSYIKTYFCIPCTERWLALVKENVPVDFADNDSILFYNIVIFVMLLNF